MRLPKKTYIVFLISVIAFLLLVFLFKAEWLTIGIGRNLPVGTLITWLLIVAFAAVMLLLFNRKPEKRMRRFLSVSLKINFAMASVWGFVSFLLSGNWSFNFGSGIWFKIWIYYTSSIFVIPLIVFIICATILLIHKIFNSK
jgi:hypothetical protein